MSFTSDLLTGVAEHLAAEGVGTWTPDGVYTTGQTGIFIAVVPVAPNRCITLTDYDPSGANHAGDVTPRIQVRCRGDEHDPVSVIDLAAAVRDAIDGLAHVTFGAVEVSQINHVSGVPLGIDGSDRHERSDNYDIQARRVTALRTE